MYRHSFAAVVSISLVTVVSAAPPEQALKYHDALLKRPNNEALFERFFGAWVDEQPEDSLGVYLAEQARKNGGQEWGILAHYQLRRGREDEALGSLGKAIQALPEDAALSMERGKLRLRRLDFEAAREDLGKVAAGKDEVAALEAAKLIGKSWLRQGKSEEAVKAWDAVLAAHPKDEDLLEDLVETAAAEGEMKQALAYNQRLIEVTKDPYQKTVRGMRRGDLLARAGRNDEAVEAYAATLPETGEGSWLERELLAQVDKVYRKQDRMAELRKELGKLAEANPRRLLIQRQLAKVEASQGDADAAIGRYREVLKRSPGDRELREEFVRLLLDGERLEDAATELQRMIELAPADSGLWLQLAGLRFRQQKKDEVLAALKQARTLLGTDTASGVRIAGLMLQYGLDEQGEALLRELAGAPDGAAAVEALANYYGRSHRKDEAVALFRKMASTEELETVLRAAGAISGLGEGVAAFELLVSRGEKFGAEPRYLAVLGQTSLAAGKPAEAMAAMLKLVRLAKQPAELGESVGLAVRVVQGAGKGAQWREMLEKQKDRSVAETCLLAALDQALGDPVSANELLEKAKDPTLVRFHAALLDKQGDFESAIVALGKLEKTEEGRKAAFFKELSELQQRAGKSAEAYATVERWKLIAPGDKVAWTSATRLLREMGKTEEAVKMARQAASRFEGDVDMIAALAGLQEEAGQWAEAEAIYWRLYDESTAPADQARWAGQLAQMALKNGRTSELAEKLQERSKGNRGALGPILAQAELQRVLQNDDKRRDLLMEAVRLQPKDVDLHMQVAALDEQGGDADRARAMLEEALPFDTTGRARSALAQAYIRDGQTLKGLRELRLLAGKQGSHDPRSIEDSAVSLADAKFTTEAITFLREEAGPAPDWRTRYLLAMLLEEDGKEQEARGIFQGLLEAQGDLGGLKKPAAPAAANANGSGNGNGNGNAGANGTEKVSAAERVLGEEIAAVAVAYAHRQGGTGGRSPYGGGSSGPQATGGSAVGSFFLPDEAEMVRKLARLHLLAMSADLPDGAAIRAGLKGGSEAGDAFSLELIIAARGGSQGWVNVLRQHPEHPGVIDWMVDSGNPVPPDVLKRILDGPVKLPPRKRFMLQVSTMRNGRIDETAWKDIIASVRAMMADKSHPIDPTVMWYLLNLIGNKSSPCPEPLAKEAKQIVHDGLKAMVDDGSNPELDGMMLGAMAMTGTPEEWIDQLNKIVRDSRKAPMAVQNPRFKGSYYLQRLSSLVQNVIQNQANGSDAGQLQTSWLQPPQVTDAPLASLPYYLPYLWPSRNRNSSEDQDEDQDADDGATNASIPLAEMMKRITRVESPALRAWLAMRTNDKAGAAKALAVTPPKEEAADFEILKGIDAEGAGKHLAAYQAFGRARALRTADRDFTLAMTYAQLAVAVNLTDAEKAEAAEELKGMLMMVQRTLGATSGPMMAQVGGKIGLADWAARFVPARPASGGAVATGQPTNPNGPAGFSNAPRTRVGSGSSGGPQASPVDKLTKFVAAKKYDAAAREGLRLLRGANRSSGSSTMYINGHLFRGGDQELDGQVAKALGRAGLDEMMKLIEPGEAKGLVRRLDYIDLCLRVGRDGVARKELAALEAERPTDPEVAARFVARMPEADQAQRLKLLTTFAADPRFRAQLEEGLTALEGLGEAAVPQAASVMALVADWLDTLPAEAAAKTDVTWVTGRAKEFFDGGFGSRNGLRESGGREEGGKPSGKELAIGGKLARAMVKHPATAEDGFKLLASAPGLKATPEELSQAARDGLAGAVESGGAGSDEDEDTSYRRMISRQMGESSTGKTPAEWLAGRLDAGEYADEVLPPEWVKRLAKKDARVGTLLVALKELKTPDQVQKLWAAGAMDEGGGSAVASLREAVLKRIARIPGTARIFIEQLAALKPGQAGMAADAKGTPLMATAMKAAAGGSEADRDAVAKVLSKLFFGEKVDWEKGDARKLYQNAYRWQQALVSLEDAATISRLMPAFYRAGLPLGTDSSSSRIFSNGANYETVADLEGFLKETGWLEDAASWNPHRVWVMEFNRSGTSIQMTARKQMLMDEQIAKSLDSEFSGSSNEVAKHLSERTEGKFGSLMAAAAFSRGEARGRYATRAFTECAPELKKLPQAKLDDLAAMLDWVPAAEQVNLPAPFHDQIKKQHDGQMADLRKRANAFMTSKATVPDPFKEANALVREIAPTDIDLAVKVFLEADRRFTAGLAHGGSISFKKHPTYGFDLPARDVALLDLYEDSDSVLLTDISLGLRFFKRVTASKEGGRFSCFGVLTSIGNHMFYADMSQGTSLYEREESVFGLVAAADPDVRDMAAMAGFGAFPHHWSSSLEPQYMNAMMEIAGKHRADQPLATRCAMLAATMCNLWGSSAANQQTALDAMGELLADDSLPEISRMNLAIQMVSRYYDVGNYDQVLQPLAKLFEDYWAGPRSAVNPYAWELLRRLTESDMTLNALAAQKRISKAFWNNVEHPKEGGHTDIPPIMAEALLALAANTGDNARTDAMFDRAKADATGNIVIIDRLLRNHRYDLAMKLMPGPDQAMERPHRMALYSNDLEDALNGLRATKPDPAQLVILEMTMLDQTPGIEALGAQESPRSRMTRLAEDFRRNPPPAGLERMAALVTYSNASRLWAWDLGDAFIHDATELPLARVLAERDANAPLKKGHGTRSKVTGWQINFHYSAAFIQMGRGEVTLLEKIREAFRDRSAKSGNSEEAFGTYFAEFLRQSLLGIATDVTRGETEGFSKAFDVFAEMALDTQDPGAEVRAKSLQEVLAICHFLANWDGHPERFEALVARLPDKNDGGFVRDNGFGKLMELAGSSPNWKNPGFTSCREGMLRVMLSKPELVDCFPKDASWMDGVEKALPEGEFQSWAAVMPNEWARELRPGILVWLGRKLHTARMKDEAMAAFNRAAGECQDDTRIEFRNVALLERVDLLHSVKRDDEARTVMEEIRPDQVRKDWRDKYNALHSALGMNAKK